MDRKAEPETLLAGLAWTLACVESAAAALTPAELRIAPAAGGWSANEILWHIRATADVHGEHIARILDEDEPRWRHVSPRARMKKSRYDQMQFEESAHALAEQRSELIARLSGRPPAAWERFARVWVAHRESEWRLTLRAQVWGMVSHEEVHCRELDAIARGGSGG